MGNDRVSSIALFCWFIEGAEFLLKEAQRNVVSFHTYMGAEAKQFPAYKGVTYPLEILVLASPLF